MGNPETVYALRLCDPRYWLHVCRILKSVDSELASCRAFSNKLVSSTLFVFWTFFHNITATQMIDWSYSFVNCTTTQAVFKLLHCIIKISLIGFRVCCFIKSVFVFETYRISLCYSSYFVLHCRGALMELPQCCRLCKYLFSFWKVGV